MSAFEARPVGLVESSLTDRAAAPKQGDEDGTEAWLSFEAGVGEALSDVAPGDVLVLITWLHQADRDVLSVHPRGDRSNPITGVFSTRSPDRPNPIGLHDVTVVAVDGFRIRVRELEAINGTPIIDVKPVLGERADR